MGQHSPDLVRSSPNYNLVVQLLKPLERKICVSCNRIVMRCTDKCFCDKCDEKRPAASRIIRDLTGSQRETSTTELLSIQKTKFMLRRTVPRKLCTLWSDLLTDITLEIVDAAKESEARRAFKRYLMLKAVLVQPVRGGRGRLNRNTNQTEKLMSWFLQGKEDEIWQIAR